MSPENFWIPGVPCAPWFAKPPVLRDLDGTKPVTGDLRDPESLQRAVAGCGSVYHVAADYRLWAKDPDELYRSNVEGTRNLIAAAKQAGCGTHGLHQHRRLHRAARRNEANRDLDQMSGAYKRSKFLAEQVALEERELPVVVVNPTAPIGDYDVKPTPTGAIVLDFLKGNMPAFIDTGLNLVDVRDVADGHLLAEQHARAPANGTSWAAKILPSSRF